MKERMSDTENTGIQVYIGDEMPVQTMKDLSLIHIYLLLSIINNVLDMARIESGKVELDEDYVKIRDIYQGIYKIFQAEDVYKRQD